MAIQIFATDSLVTRNRTGRITILLVWTAFVLIFFPLVGSVVSISWFDYGMFGFFVGCLISIVILASTLERFIVVVGGIRAFVTVDQLRAFLGNKSAPEDGDKNVYVTYGPGVHASYPWEARDASRNVSLEEASETFSTNVQTPSGTITVEGSVRLRPDICRLVAFLSGVAAMASDITDIIKSHIIEELANKATMSEVLTSVPALNRALHEKFGLGTSESKNEAKAPEVSEFEERFGVNVGDVTIAKILPSKEVQKTMSGIAEAEIIAQGTAILLDYENPKSVREALAEGALTRKDYNEARDRFMATSDNVTMDVKSNEWKISIDGLERLDPGAVQGLATLATLYAQNAQRNPQGNQQRGGGSRSRRRQRRNQNQGGNDNG
jgi:regulator of protease activity HflC (stomatin/prohibitin superfamily)